MTAVSSIPLLVTLVLVTRGQELTRGCATGDEGKLFPDPRDCSKFITCVGQQPISFDCASGLLFDPKSKVWPLPRPNSQLKPSPCNSPSLALGDSWVLHRPQPCPLLLLPVPYPSLPPSPASPCHPVPSAGVSDRHFRQPARGGSMLRSVPSTVGVRFPSGQGGLPFGRGVCCSFMLHSC